MVLFLLWTYFTAPFIIEKCNALLERMLLCSVGSISRSVKALLGRAKAKVHWTLWHPSRALLDNKRTSECEVLFCYPRSASLFSKHNCFAARVRFLGALKLSSVVPVPRSTGPCATRLALFPSLTNRYSFPSLFHKPFPNDLSFPDIPAQKQLHHNSLFCTNI